MALTPADLDAVCRPLGEARPFPAEAYCDPRNFAYERRTLFDRAWRCVGRASEVARAGQWLRTPIGRSTLVVHRGEDGALRAFSDLCTHRGAPLFEGARGEAIRLVCGYHGWAFDGCGRLCEAPHLPAGIDRSRLGLRTGRAEVQNGLLFATGDAAAPGLREATGAPPPWIERLRLERTRAAHAARWTVAANWKLVVENFQEAHHFERVHPLLEARTPGGRARSWPSGLDRSRHGGSAWLGGVMPLAPGIETVSLSGRRNGRPLVAAPEDAAEVHDALLFPLFLTSLQPDYLLTYRLDPIAVDRTVVEQELLVADEGPPNASGEWGDVVHLWAQIHEEDRLVCERQQRGMEGGGWRPVCYATCEDGVHAFDQLAAAALRGIAR